MSDISLDGDAAVVGGIHTDSHNTENHYNTTTNTTNNSTVSNQHVYEAQKTTTEILLQNETLFLQAVQECLVDGILDQLKLAQINQLRMQWHVAPDRANLIVEQVRRSFNMMQGDKGNEFLAEQLLSEVFNAVQGNQTEILRHKFSSLEQLARVMTDGNVQFYYHLLLASFYPDKCTVSFIQSRTDNYWQLFWAHVAFIKICNADNATQLLPRLGGFGAEQGNIALLMALDNLSDFLRNGRNDYYRQQTEQYLNQAVEKGMDERLGSLWYAVKELMQGEPQPEDWYRFYVERTLCELRPKPRTGMSVPPQMPTPPPMPKFNAQNVQLTQMQGFNPLQAASQMGLGVGAIDRIKDAPAGMVNNFATDKSVQPGTAVPPPMPTSAKTTAVQTDKTFDEPDPLQDHYGLILTHSLRLAEKYGCSQHDVCDVFNRFVQSAFDQQMYWEFIDLSDLSICANPDDWEQVNNAVDTYINHNGKTTGIQLHLFIVGGDDVVSVARIFGSSRYAVETIQAIPTDMAYSFPGRLLADMADGNVELELSVNNVRNNVSRLPLENGSLNTTIEQDLGAYFNISSLYGGGIPVGNVVMISNSEWIPASATMTQHLPLLCNSDDPELVRGGMYVSPKLLTSDKLSVGVYRQSICQAGMLMFNLHGSDAQGLDGFYSSKEAFNPALLRDSTARVFNTVACFGARYADYARDDSMLLQSLYGGGVLLYTGSLISVPMYRDCNNDEARELLLNPGTGSEVFMRLYPLYQFKGMTAGEALLRAKLDYFNMCRHIESDEFSLSTILMFGLYGNPMLHVRQHPGIIQSALQNESMPPAPVVAEKSFIRRTAYRRIEDKRQNAPSSLVGQIQNYTAQNIQDIRSIVEQFVYDQLGIPPRWLETIDEFSRPNADGSLSKGHMFSYHNPDTIIAPDTTVETDNNGKVKRIYTTK